ncbi:hypothetical protein [Bradyrhizobium sp. AS23.2]|uniref:hypothetical protein n=1 Tax=Bradyrhizobium sp. AS23.2 TaxID=1680155 RepID=UPI00093BA07A|nr:hypothetical protein [Bradyrhizobium sp. AS23.2]OKO70111.1 hypothetical protein AC630_35510 [Bradyrhizobium sp. AS23.2]
MTIQQLANAIGLGEVIARMAMRGLAAAVLAAADRLTGGSRLDVFAREAHPGFAQFGKEISKFLEVADAV